MIFYGLGGRRVLGQLLSLRTAFAQVIRYEPAADAPTVGRVLRGHALLTGVAHDGHLARSVLRHSARTGKVI
jgi:hypothetical protein